jgi:PncC family amidohydrolase
VRVRITAKADDENDAVWMIGPVEDELRARLGPAAVPGNYSSVADALVDMLRARRETMAAAESLTGGLIGVEATRAPGASDVFLGSLVCYDLDAKRNVAGIDSELLERHGPVSEEVAAALARSAASKFGADLGVSSTGAAGPEPHGARAPGTVFVGACYGGRTEVRKPRAYGNRANVRAMAVTGAFDLARRLLEGSL